MWDAAQPRNDLDDKSTSRRTIYFRANRGAEEDQKGPLLWVNRFAAAHISSRNNRVTGQVWPTG